MEIKLQQYIVKCDFHILFLDKIICFAKIILPICLIMNWQTLNKNYF